MKTGVVRLSDIAAAGGRFDAEYYLCPTKSVDEAIARTESCIANAQKRLESLKTKRAELIASAQARGISVERCRGWNYHVFTLGASKCSVCGASGP